ncbi:MAG TPA: DUF2892 domain-containing protein [Methylophilaceae bacterium]|nr:DUF2892 domain-containing protein [Methylophilaceae bacterium]
METNVGTVDRVLRVIISLALLSLVFLIDSHLRWIGMIGLVTLFTAVTSWCPAYAMLGIKTRRTPPPPQE